MASRVEPMNYHAARWLEDSVNPQSLAGLGANVLDVTDRRGRTVLLFPSEWSLQYAERENPKLLSEVER